MLVHVVDRNGQDGLDGLDGQPVTIVTVVLANLHLEWFIINLVLLDIIFVSIIRRLICLKILF